MRTTKGKYKDLNMVTMLKSYGHDGQTRFTWFCGKVNLSNIMNRYVHGHVHEINCFAMSMMPLNLIFLDSLAINHHPAAIIIINAHEVLHVWSFWCPTVHTVLAWLVVTDLIASNTTEHCSSSRRVEVGGGGAIPDMITIPLLSLCTL